MPDVAERIRTSPTPVLRALGVLALFAALAVAHTWPLVKAPSTDIHRGPDPGGGMWSLTEMSRQLVRDPANLMDGNVFYPFPVTLAVLDHQLAGAAMVAPLIVAGASGVFAYNALLLTAFFLNGVFMFLLARKLSGSAAGGLVAGCAFAFSSYHAYHLPQSHLLTTQFIPLALLALHGYLERPTSKRWGGFAAATLLVALSSWHVAVLGALTIGLIAVWTIVANRRDARIKVGGLAAVALICGIALLPFAGAYARLGAQWPPRTEGGRETVGTLTLHSADVVGLLTPPEGSRSLYAALASGFEHREPGIFPGLVVVVMAAAALAGLQRLRGGAKTKKIKLLRGWLAISAALVAVVVIAAAFGSRGDPVVALLRPIAPFALFGMALAGVGLVAVRRAETDDPALVPTITYACLAAAGALLALGPRVSVGGTDAGSGLWRLDLLPLRLIIRAPDRLSLLLMLGVAVLAGIGMARLLEHRSRRAATALTVVVLLLVNADLAFRSLPFLTVPAPRQVDEWLAEFPEPGAVIEYPLVGNYWTAYASQRYERRTVNGQGYLFPWEYKQMEDLPDFSPAQMAILWEHFHPRYVVVRGELYAPAERAAAERAITALGTAMRPLVRFGGDAVYELSDQGGGSELFRRWPLSALEGMRSLEVVGSVSGGRDDTVGELVVSLNGEILLEARGVSAEAPTLHTLAFDPQSLVRGINVFRIWADYRLTSSDESRLIGTTGLRLPADVSIRSDRDRARVQINGRVIRPDKGYFLAVLDPVTGEILDSGEFNVSWSPQASTDLTAFVTAVPDGYPVVVATEFDVSRDLTEDAVRALARLGLEADLRGRFQVLHAAIGVKGAAPGTVLEASGDPPTLTLEIGQPDRREVRLQSVQLRR